MAASARNLASLLVRTARAWPRLPAIAIGSRPQHDYAALIARVARIATGLAASGLARGERVVIVARNVPQYIETLFACWWVGAVAVPVNAKLHPSELAYVLDDSGARFAFVDDRWAAALAATPPSSGALVRIIAFESNAYEGLLRADASEAPAPCDDDDPAWLFYTSGTTGRPKGVMITHANLRAMAQCFMSDVESIEPGDALLHPAPLSHGSGLYVLPHIARGAVNVIPESGGFDAAEIVELIAAWNRACFFAAPTMVKRLVASPSIADARLDQLKCIVYGGGPMYVADCRQAYAVLGPRLAQIYGQGETPMTITAMDRALVRDAIERDDDARLGSVGIAQTGIELRIGAADDSPLACAEIGEVLVRGPTVMRGYWNNPQATAKTLANGWLHTGDVGSLDDNGFLTLKDRSKDLIISGGSNIYPREVEEALLAHAGIAEAAVIGRAHRDWGEEVVACVVARAPLPDATARQVLERELDAICLTRIARFKRPRAYVFVDELPKNSTGKVLKRELREAIAASARDSKP